MFGSLGAPELLFIFALALLIFGPSKLPELGRTLGKAMAEFRNAANDFKRTLNAEAIEREMRDADPRRAVRDTLADAKKEMDEILKGGGPRAARKDAAGPADAGAPGTETANEAATVARGSSPGPSAPDETTPGETAPDETAPDATNGATADGEPAEKDATPS